MLDTRLDSVRGMIAEGVVIDVAAERPSHWCSQGSIRPRSEVQTLQVGVEQIAADRRCPRRALTHVVITIDEEAVTSGVVDDVVVRNEQAGIGLRSVAKDRLARTRDA
jgi:hypothetical protein